MYMTVEGVKFRNWDGPKKYQHRYFKQLTIFLFTQMFVSSITPRIQRTWHMTCYPPPTRPDFEETLQSKEDSEGCACCLHHLLLVGRVASELWKYIVKVIVIRSSPQYISRDSALLPWPPLPAGWPTLNPYENIFMAHSRVNSPVRVVFM